MKKFILTIILLPVIAIGSTYAQRPAGPVHGQYVTPVIDKEDLKHEPRPEKGILSDKLGKSDAARLRKEYREVRKQELKAKAQARTVNREREKEKRQRDKASWANYKQKHDRQGRYKG